MIAGIASLTFIPILAIALVHLLWAFGFTYPAKTEAALAKTVLGYKGVTRMQPRMVSLGMAFAILAAGIWGLELTDPAPDIILSAGGIVLGLVFLWRGVIGYTSWWRQLTPEEPFATFDKKLYSPLCLGISLGYFTLTALRIF
ncbi:hypothetical protein MNBD_ALPHA12-584 [hydrothermal vent metagenome]|uniref:DUF3995 domain-containing protein n=1 Tax=hydrothermal vent metagenome TaxID=652676 RepID=A0A3B0TXL6_9ZZZZ